MKLREILKSRRITNRLLWSTLGFTIIMLLITLYIQYSPFVYFYGIGGFILIVLVITIFISDEIEKKRRLTKACIEYFEKNINHLSKSDEIA